MPRDVLREFSVGELRLFLATVDAELRHHATIKILGGSAIALAYNLDLGTTDIDTFETDLLPLEHAIQKAREQTGLEIPVSPRGGAIGDRPYESDDRLLARSDLAGQEWRTPGRG
jgi:hypothetical protein